MARLKIAMVGAGAGRGQSWMGTLAKLSEFTDKYEFCGLCEVQPERAAASSARWGVPAYSQLLELFDAVQPDVILNGAPGDSNVMAVQMAARHHVHVVTEIPVAPTRGLADLLIETCQHHQVAFEVTEQVWLWAAEQLKRAIIEAGLIGTVQHARLYYSNKADYHGINGLRMLVPSQPRRVWGYTQEVAVPPFEHYLEPIRDRDRWDAAVIEFENGVTCLFESPPRGAIGPRWDLEGDRGSLIGNELTLGGSGKLRRYPFITETTTVDGQTIFDHVRVDTDPPVVFENPYRAQRCADGDEVARMDLLLGFHRAVTEGTPVTYSPQQSRLDIEILFAMRESHERGNVWVDLPLTAPTPLEEAIDAEFVRCYGDPRSPEALVAAPFRQRCVRYTCANWE